MTLRNMKNNTKKLAAILPLIAFGIIMSTILVTHTTLTKAEASPSMLPIRPVLLTSFSTTVNGHEKAEVVTTMNRGEIVQLDILATPKISGISGDMQVYSSLPECGTITIDMGCTPHGITVSLPTSNRVSSTAHVPLTISVSKDMPPGTYWYSLAITPIKDPFKNLPESSGYVDAFAIKVV